MTKPSSIIYVAIIGLIIICSNPTWAKNIENLKCNEKCKQVNEPYRIDTVVSFIEMYNDGKNDTITESLFKFSELNIDYIKNIVNATIHDDIARARVYIGKIDSCVCNEFEVKIDTIKVNYGSSRIIPLMPIKFDLQEISNIRKRSTELLENNCGEMFLTYEYKIKEIINNPALRLESCNDLHKCGNDIYSTYCVQMTESVLSNGMRRYPKSGGYRNEVYFDKKIYEDNPNITEWKMVLENQYGYDTTIVINYKKRANKR